MMLQEDTNQLCSNKTIFKYFSLKVNILHKIDFNAPNILMRAISIMRATRVIALVKGRRERGEEKRERDREREREREKIEREREREREKK